MTGTTRSSEGLDPRRRKLKFRCWHRGIREMDLIMGRFADACIDRLTDQELDQLELLMEVADPDLFLWVTAEQATPAAYDSVVLRRLRAFHLDPRACSGEVDTGSPSRTCATLDPCSSQRPGG
jgi:antitoxin CptB